MSRSRYRVSDLGPHRWRSAGLVWAVHDSENRDGQWEGYVAAAPDLEAANAIAQAFNLALTLARP